VVKTIEPREPDASDSDLLQRVQRGEVEAFAPVVRRHLPAIRAFVAIHLPVPHLADEIAHEAFVVAFRRIREFDTRRPFRPWLRGIAWQLVRAELQRFAREQVNRSRLEQLQLAELTASLTPDAPAGEVVFVKQCLAELPPHRRRLIEGRYRHERTAAQVAAQCGGQLAAEGVHCFHSQVAQDLRSCSSPAFYRQAGGFAAGPRRWSLGIRCCCLDVNVGGGDCPVTDDCRNTNLADDKISHGG
jgi:RNA polymerase sigma factor (sigma-70 family)